MRIRYRATNFSTLQRYVDAIGPDELTMEQIAERAGVTNWAVRKTIPALVRFGLVRLVATRVHRGKRPATIWAREAR